MKILFRGALLSVPTLLMLLNFKYTNMKNINDFLKSQVDAEQTPSIQYAFFDIDSVLYEFRYGLKDVKLRKNVDANTTYHLYSVTKTFTALAVLQLAESGKVKLDNAVKDYLKDFPYGSEITVQQLLSHTSGIANPMPLKWIHLEEDHSKFNHDPFFSGIFSKHADLDFAPGSNFKYSNLGYVFLGQLIERVSGQTFEEYVSANILKRSGIENGELSFTIDPETHATGYHKYLSVTNAVLGFLIDKQKFMGPREGSWKPFKRFYNNGKAYGGIHGSAKGLINYAQALLADESVLLNDSYKQMLFTENVINGKSTGMSFSWFTGTLKGNRYFAHAGGGGGYYVELRVYPQLHVGSVIMYNRSGMTDERVLNKADSFFLTEAS